MNILHPRLGNIEANINEDIDSMIQLESRAIKIEMKRTAVVRGSFIKYYYICYSLLLLDMFV